MTRNEMIARRLCAGLHVKGKRGGIVGSNPAAAARAANRTYGVAKKPKARAA